jgi:HK97 family phage prohead protease
MDYKSLQFKAESVDQQERIFKGYASTYDLDSGGDIIVKGAFEKSMQSGRNVKVLWQHKTDVPIGKPILMREDDKGLYVEAKISQTTAGNDAMTLLMDGVIDSMSIGYITKESEFRNDGVRLLKEVDLFEFSLVSYPMNDKAVITQVKNQFDVRELENILREAGYSNSQAKKMATAGIKSLREVGDEQKALAELHAAISNLQSTLKV